MSSTHSDVSLPDPAKDQLAHRFEGLMRSLHETHLDVHEAARYRERFDVALGRALKGTASSDPSPRSLQEGLGGMKKAKINWARLIQLGCILATGILLIIIALAIIFVPMHAPAFEIATLYNFNPEDGVTISDLIALVLFFTGVYLLTGMPARTSRWLKDNGFMKHK